MKTYFLAFGSGNPTSNTGLAPTFTVFKTAGGSLVSGAPGITELPTSTGLYYFTYGPTSPIVFLIDGGSALSTSIRYIPGALDPIQSVDEKVGTSADSFGSTSVDPTTIFGYVKRGQEFNEGNSTFTKSTGVWDILSRGSSTMLIEKTLTDTTGTVTKA